MTQSGAIFFQLVFVGVLVIPTTGNNHIVVTARQKTTTGDISSGHFPNRRLQPHAFNIAPVLRPGSVRSGKGVAGNRAGVTTVKNQGDVGGLCGELL